ncbi:hypothetical protein ACTJJ7_11200 [Phyllobacterium sp. 22229]|uniref:Uncharacterized protein n=1 Tax=Agrobacterium radiobacter TaxID=362 RepID=A0ABD5LT58_AGRRD
MHEIWEAYAIVLKPAELIPSIIRQIADLTKMEECVDCDTVLSLQDGRVLLRADKRGIMIRVEGKNPLLSCGIKSVVTSVLGRSSGVINLPLQWRRGNGDGFSGIRRSPGVASKAAAPRVIGLAPEASGNGRVA